MGHQLGGWSRRGRRSKHDQTRASLRLVRPLHGALAAPVRYTGTRVRRPPGDGGGPSSRGCARRGERPGSSGGASSRRCGLTGQERGEPMCLTGPDATPELDSRARPSGSEDDVRTVDCVRSTDCYTVGSVVCCLHSKAGAAGSPTQVTGHRTQDTGPGHGTVMRRAPPAAMRTQYTMERAWPCSTRQYQRCVARVCDSFMATR